MSTSKPLPPFRPDGHECNAICVRIPSRFLACESGSGMACPPTRASAGLTNTAFSTAARAYVEKGRVWRIGPEMDADAMHEAAGCSSACMISPSFRSTACRSASRSNALDRLNVRREGDHIIVEAAALSFLHHQVRSMVGCLAAVGLGRWTTQDLKAALAARNRSALAENAPPEGLYFVAARVTRNRSLTGPHVSSAEKSGNVIFRA